MRVVYVNGSFVTEADAKISVFDRGFLFGDAVYEVTAVVGGKLLDFDAHVKRLVRSLVMLGVEFSMTGDELLKLQQKLVALNDLQEGLVYMQVSRGLAERDFVMPDNRSKNSVVMFTQAKKLIDNPMANKGLRVKTTQDLRWGLCDIKTVQLLFASMAKTQAVKEGYDDAWLVRDGFVTEGTSNNAFIITKQGVVVTRPLSQDILHGITRASVLQCVSETGLKLEERAFSVQEAENAAEAFVTSASGFVMPVVEINKKLLSDGQPGSFSLQLREIYIKRSLASAI